MGTVVDQDIFKIQTGYHLFWHGRCHRIADDMVIAGRDEKEHDRNFLAFMEKCMSNNLTLNAKKDSVQAITGIFL